MKKLLLTVLVFALVLLTATATASAKTPTIKSLAKSLAALQKAVKSQATTISTLTTQLTQARSDITTLQNAPATGISQAQFDALGATVAGHSAALAGLTSVVGADSSHGLQKSVADIAANPALTLSWLPTYLTLDASAENGVNGPNIVFKGANLHVESATNEYDSTGTGNLIVGWDETTAGAVRSGSNNLVCGNMNSFSSYGGFVDGLTNSIEGTYASVSGGANNVAEGSYSSVSGGHANGAQSLGATVSGGNGVVLNSATIYAWSAGGTFHNP